MNRVFENDRIVLTSFELLYTILNFIVNRNERVSFTLQG
jgi:hypothetical protein